MFARNIKGGLHRLLQRGTAGKTSSSRQMLMESGDRPHVVLVGSGWAICNTLRHLGPQALQRYSFTVVSPSNHFVYTPMLPSVCVGTVGPRSIAEPVRTFINTQLRRCEDAQIQFYEAAALSIDPLRKTLVCKDVSPVGGHKFDLNYDVLAMGVGSTTNTFGTPGASEHCYFLKTVEDARTIQQTVIDCLETASLTGDMSDDEIDRLLTFVVVGAGPTGVEIAAELRDFAQDNLEKVYPHFATRRIRVQIIEMGERLLGTYDPAVSEYTSNRFDRSDIQVFKKHQVKHVTKNSIEVLDLETKQIKTLPHGMCIWASGVRPNDIALRFASDVQSSRILETDGHLRAYGAEGPVFAMGDCATIVPDSVRADATELFGLADGNADGVVSPEEFLLAMFKARQTQPRLREFLDKHPDALPWLTETVQTPGMTPAVFEEVLRQVDRSALKPLPPTAQVAAQQGQYLADVLTHNSFEELSTKAPNFAPFKYNHGGSMAYVGQERAVIESPLLPFGIAAGPHAMWMWRGAYWAKSVSTRSKVLMAFDWAKKSTLGRDTARF